MSQTNNLQLIKMDCAEAKSLFFRIRDNDLPEESRSGFHAHLSGCTECSTLYTFVTDTLDYLRKDRVIPEDTVYLNRMVSIIEARYFPEVSTVNYSFYSRIKPVLIPLVLFISLSFGTLLGFLLSHPGNSLASDTDAYFRTLQNYSNELYISEISDSKAEQLLLFK
jgi:hypothetical protein